MQAILKRLASPVRRVSATILQEALSPGRAAAAVFAGVFLGNVPIYGLQTLAAIGVAFVFRLNKPLTLAATFINNPLLQPLLITTSVVLGEFALTGRLRPFVVPDISPAGMKAGLVVFATGSLILGVLLGAVAAGFTFVAVRARTRERVARRESRRFVNHLYAGCARADRGFVRWKLRLDRIFDLLEAEDLGSGAVVDLGCGHGTALAFAAAKAPGRRLSACDLDEGRIRAARTAFADFDADLRVEDVRRFPVPRATLILILDVLQYLDPGEQVALLTRCCEALEPGGKFAFRVHDRECGVWSRLTVAFDRLIFATHGVKRSPVILPAEEYRRVLESAGTRVRVLRFRNRLPLVHLLFVAVKPCPSEAGL